MIRHKAVFRGGCGEITRKKSRFIAHVGNVSTVEEAQEFSLAVKKRFWDARHNCTAFSVGVEHPVTRCSDDGEPAGTAGKPILEVINASGIRNIVIVVTRYFGGTLLGTGGLVKAYTEAARQGIGESDIIEKIPGIRTTIDADYTDLGKVQYILAQNQYLTENVEYTDKVVIHALIPVEEKNMLRKRIADATAGRSVICDGETVYYGQQRDEIYVFS